jgi:ketosteroid isomerase-like protein
MRAIALGLTAAWLVAACQPTERPLTEDEQAAIIEAVLQVRADLVAAAEAVDADRVLSFFTDDIVVAADGEVFARATFEPLLREAYGRLDRQIVQWHPASFTVLTSDVALMTFGGSVTTIGAAGDTAASVPTVWTEVYVRRDDAWKIAQAHLSTRPAESG